MSVLRVSWRWRARSRMFSSRCVVSVNAAKPKVAAPPLIECAARKIALRSSLSGAATSRFDEQLLHLRQQLVGFLEEGLVEGSDVHVRLVSFCVEGHSWRVLRGRRPARMVLRTGPGASGWVHRRASGAAGALRRLRRLCRHLAFDALLRLVVEHDDADAPVHRRRCGSALFRGAPAARPVMRSTRSSRRPPATSSRREALARSADSSQLL